METSIERLTPRADIPSPLGPDIAESAASYPLSFAQQRLWFLDQLRPGSAAYNVPQAWRIQGPLDPAALERALNDVIRRHESLRTTFPSVNDRPVQSIAPFRPSSFPVLDLPHDADRAKAIERWVNDEVRRPFDLEHGPLFRFTLARVADDEHVLVLTLHHIIADAQSFDILRREISAHYAARRTGHEAVLPELNIQYVDYAHWQRESLEVAGLERELVFWREYLSGPLPALELPEARRPSASPEFRGASEWLEVDRVTRDFLKDLARNEGATLFMVLLAAFKAFLFRCTGEEDVIIGTPVIGRDREELENVIGLFVNTVPVRTHLGGDPSFVELLGRVREGAMAALGHADVPFDELVRAVDPDRAPGRNPLFQVVLGLLQAYPQSWVMDNVRCSLVGVDTGTAKFDWTFLLEEGDWGIRGRLEYNTDLFEAETIGRILQHFRIFLESIAANPRQRLSQLPIMDEAERNRVLVEWNRTDAAYERDLFIHEVFERQSRRAPNATAIVFETETVSYAELDLRADRLSRRLARHGIGPHALVGLCLERSVEMIVAMIAILKAGAAYVPLDRNYPKERLSIMIEEAGLGAIVTDSRHPAPELPPNVRLVHVDLEKNQSGRVSKQDERDCAPAAPRTASPGDHPAYVMFTSGSTGGPKGVVVPHRSVVRLVRNTNYASFSADDTFLQFAPISFDASTFEIWGCLLNGGRLVVLPPGVPSLAELSRTIEQERVTVLWLTAGLFHELVDNQLGGLRGVRQLLAGGDVLSPRHVVRAARELRDCRVVNGYGPTENTTFTCCYSVPADWAGDVSVPIGRPISNTRVYVLDQNRHPVPVGVAGELYAGGDGLALGYLNQRSLTAEKFISDPFKPGARLYRTGDRVRWRPDGNLEFLGRMDRQVKIRGFRVEPAEIEAVLARHPAVREAAVVARGDGADRRHLAAYVVLQVDRRCDLARIREHVERVLPAQFVPADFVEVKELPLTANGKVDRNSLPAPDRRQAADEVVRPRNATEEALAVIWSEVVGRGAPGVHDNFFRCGGHSLLAMQMASRICKALQVELPVRMIFEAPTIATLAEQIDRMPRLTAPRRPEIERRIRPAEAAQLLSRLGELSNGEVEDLLQALQVKQILS